MDEHVDQERAERLARALEAASSGSPARDDAEADIAALTRLARRLEQELPLLPRAEDPDAEPRPAFLNHLRGELLAAATPAVERRPTRPSWSRRAATAAAALAALVAIAVSGLGRGQLSPVARGPVYPTATPARLMGAARTMQAKGVSPVIPTIRPGGPTPRPGGTPGPLSAAAGIHPGGIVGATSVTTATTFSQDVGPRPPIGAARVVGGPRPCPTATAVPHKPRRVAPATVHGARPSPPPRAARRVTPGPAAAVRCSPP